MKNKYVWMLRMLDTLTVGLNLRYSFGGYGICITL